MESSKPQREKWSMVAQNWAEVGWEQIALELREDYAEYIGKYRSKGGVRDMKYQFLQGNYLMGFRLKRDPVELESFKADPYWHGFHQPPNEHNLMLSVLNYNMKSKHDEAIQNLNYRYAKVLESFYEKGVAPDNIALRLKNNGGIFSIYFQLCNSEKPGKAEVGVETDGDDVDAMPEENPPSETSSGATADPHLGADEDGERATADDGRIEDNAIVRSANPPTDDQAVPNVPAALLAANDRGQKIEEDARLSGPPKQGHLNRANLEKELIIEFFSEELTRILASRGGRIEFEVMPCDERGWKCVTGTILRLHE